MAILKMTRAEYEEKYGVSADVVNPQIKSAMEQDASTATFPASQSDSPIRAGLKSVGNVPSSTFQLGKNVASAVVNPMDTVKGVTNAVIGGGRKIQGALSKGIETVTGAKDFGMGRNETADKTFGALVDSIKSRYGSLEKAQKTATEDPVGFGADVVAIFSGASKIPALSKVTGAIEGAVKTTATGAKTGIANKLDDVAVSQVKKALDLNPTDARRIKMPNVAGKEAEEWVLERGFQGSQSDIVSKLDDYRATTKSTVDERLAELNVPVSRTSAKSALDTLQVLKNTFEGTIGNETLLKSIDDMLTKESFTIEELNNIKRLADSELNIFKSTGALREGATAKGLFNVRDELKTLIEKEASKQGFEDVKFLNKETQIAYEISDALKRRLDVKSKLPEIGLRDGILAVGGLATGGFPIALGLIISKKVLESASFRTYLANKLKSLPDAQRIKIQSDITKGNYVDVLKYLAPIANEFEMSQETAQGSATQPQE